MAKFNIGSSDFKIVNNEGEYWATVVGTSGNDVIADFTIGTDKISLTGSNAYKGYSLSSNDVKVSLTGGTITFKNKATEVLKLADSLGISIKSGNYEERWFMDNEELGIRNEELDSILNKGSNVISNDYNYDVTSDLTNLNKQTVKITQLTYTYQNKK